MDKKKLMAVATAALGAFVFGESQIMEMNERLGILEELCLPAAEEPLSDEDQIEAEEAEAESQPLIEADEE